MFSVKYLCLLLLFSTVCAIEVDRRHKTGLRSQILTCRSTLEQFFCQIKCDVRPALCIEDTCYCMSIVREDKAEERKSQVLNKKLRHQQLKKKTNTLAVLTPSDVQYLDLDTLYSLRPTVRHHIAHFCPDLEVARACIRKCMEKGRPAFCGKDHVCYCGHKYEHTGKDDDGDAKAIYAQFKDLYQKYFGTDNVMESVDV